ncbi:MAG: DinB family protein [Bacteroidota bacterium]
MNATNALFKEESIKYMDMNIPRIEKCLEMMTEEELWWRPNAHVNSVGNLLLHLCGNITQWITAGLGTIPDRRERDLEFSTRSGYTKAVLLEKIKQVNKEATAVIRSMDEARLQKTYAIQNYDNTGYGVIIHVTEHFSYHVGQIATMTKFLKARDLGFYSDQDLNGRIAD